ncbi:hypothetical protein SAMN05444158_1534 [Bradyrhizobium canariense]|uniref:Uncharacterized protein n=2 Tax=Bradyrhizobium canariense TaxID=255045 RepID=A0A1H1QTR8_9BRAD|nr:hypothetical protein SAMN05444158_1534 [Bradyrhizobium canariense]
MLPTVPDLTGRGTGTLTKIDQRLGAEELAAAAFQQAADAILKRAPDALADADERQITGHIPLPKKRPIPRP